MLDVIACISENCTDQKQHLIQDFLTKSFDKTLQTCVDVANEYLQMYNTGADVKSHFFCSLNQYKYAGYTIFCLHLFSLTNFFEKNQYFHI